MTHQVHPITIQTYRQAAQILGLAFEDEPVSVAVYNGFPPSKRVRALTFDFSTELLLCIRKGHPIQVDEDGKMVAAAVIYPPGAYPLPVIDQWLILFKSILRNGWYDIKAWNKWVNEVEKNHPTESHFYLEYLGVEPGYQGMGFGSSILKHLTTKADEAGVGCYLENANPRNIPFYQRAGFQIIREMEIITIPTWFMWRPPCEA